MPELVAQYWWICLFTVPALAIAIKLLAERSGLVDTLNASLQKKLSGFEHSYDGHWVVTVSMRDGRRYSGVVLNKRFQAPQAPLPFNLRDVDDIAWEGLVASPMDEVVQLSEGRPGIT